MTKINIDVVPVMKAKSLSVSMTVPFACSQECVKLLLADVPCNSDKMLFKGSEEACLVVALFKIFQNKFLSTATFTNKFKSNFMLCNSHGDSFVISWNTATDGTSLKKVIVNAVKCLKPTSLYANYAINIRKLGGSASKEYFSYVVNKMIDALNSEIHFVAIGKIKLDPAKFDEIKKMSNATLDIGSKLSGGKAPESHPTHNHEGIIQLHASNGTAAIITYHYLLSKNITATICGKTIYVYTQQSKIEKLGDKNLIAAFVASGFTKLDKDEVVSGLILAYNANSAGEGTGNAILGLTKKNVNFADLIKSTLK